MIAIGGLGGSGTRAVAKVFTQAGVYMGDDLNGVNDNLLFTRLFKNPKWYRSASEKEVRKRFDIFERYMSQGAITLSDFVEIYRSATSNEIFRSKIECYIELSGKIFKKRKRIEEWGWKEPNTQIYINELMEHFKDLKYIHVVRHGLDMAYSKNKQQLKNWGWKFNIHLSGGENERELAIDQLNYWIRSNQFVKDTCSKHPERCLIVYHEEFCNDPLTQIDRMLDFTGIITDIETRENLYRIPKNTGSNERFKDHDISIFSAEQIEQVIALGCPINS